MCILYIYICIILDHDISKYNKVMHSSVNYGNIKWTLNMSPVVDNVSIYDDINKFYLLSHSQKLPPNNMHNKSQYKMRFIHYVGNCFFSVSSQSFQVQTTRPFWNDNISTICSHCTSGQAGWSIVYPGWQAAGCRWRKDDRRAQKQGWRDLVGGFNPIEKYARQIGTSPQGEKRWK